MFGSRILLKALKNIMNHTSVRFKLRRSEFDTLPIESRAHCELGGVATDENVTPSLCVL